MYLNVGALFTLGFIVLLLASLWRESARKEAIWDTERDTIEKLDRAVKTQYLTEDEASRAKKAIRGY